jgi:Protein of unknown function (DUF4232)
MITSALQHGAPDGPAGRRTLLRKTRRTMTALVAATALAAGGGGMVALAGNAAAAATAAAPAPRCQENSLATGLYGYETGNYDGNGQGGFILTLTNIGGGTCSVKGYPGLGLQNARHDVVRSRTHWGSTYFAADPGRHLIALSPGETASASIGFVYGGRRKADASYLEVTPPNGYDHAVIVIPDGVGKISNGNLYVTAMARHTPFQGSTGQCCSG